MRNGLATPKRGAKGGFVPLWVLVIVFLALLFAPIPYLYGPVICAEPLVYPGKYKPCPKEGDIGWSPSIAKRIWWKITKPAEERAQPDAEGKACGGLHPEGVDMSCPTGYICQVDPNGPLDTPGKCTKIEGKACGGFGGETGEFACPKGYKCKYPEPIYPDAGGKCVKI